ncbi:MAG: FadR/GntR family transcriptional regulator [Nitrospinota bacterium]
MPKFHKISRLSLSKEIVQQVKRNIYGGSLKPGEKLPSERELARLFGVGRPSVREALNQLEALGLVEIRSFDGIYVRSASLDSLVNPLREMIFYESKNILDFLEVRKVFESFSVKKAIEEASESEIESLRKTLEGMGAALERGEPFDELDAEFHSKIVKATHNNVLVHILDNFTSLFYSLESFKRAFSRQADSRAIYEQHVRVFQAIEARKKELAESSILEHLEYVSSVVSQIDFPAHEGRH